MAYCYARMMGMHDDGMRRAAHTKDIYTARARHGCIGHGSRMGMTRHSRCVGNDAKSRPVTLEHHEMDCLSTSLLCQV